MSCPWLVIFLWQNRSVLSFDPSSPEAKGTYLMDELGQRSRAHLAQLLSRFPTEDVVSLSITPGLAEETLPLSRDFLVSRAICHRVVSCIQECTMGKQNKTKKTLGCQT